MAALSPQTPADKPHAAVHFDARSTVEFHCEHDDGEGSYRIGSLFPITIYAKGTDTAVVELGERLIRAAIEHASDMSPEAIWVEYLSVMLERAQLEAQVANQKRYPSLPWITDVEDSPTVIYGDDAA
jgi:hypothetical protein